MTNKITRLLDNYEQILVQAVERGRDKLIELRKERVKTGQDENGGTYGTYQRSQERRRNKENLQTEKKDFGFYGTLFDNFKEIARTISPQKAEIQISFEGQHKRRKDQTAASNLDVAQWLTEQTGRKIIGISKKEEEQIKEAVSKGVKQGIMNAIGKVSIQ
jgi:hypothetical protein